jgi:branched-chain amino acid transport system substrate-binding protein
MTQSCRDGVGGWSTLMVSGSLSRRAGCLLRAACAMVLLVAAAFDFAASAEPAPPARGAAPTLKIAVTVSVTGPSVTVGVPVLDAARLAVEEANADGGVPRLELVIYDDRSNEEGAQEVARQIAAGDALVVVGPGSAMAALAAGPIYAEAGLASIVPYAHSAGGPAHATTFWSVLSMSDMGASLANYLRYALGGTRAVVICKNNGSGRPFMAGFRGAAERLGLTAAYHAFNTAAEAEEAARLAATDQEQPAIVLGVVENDAKPILVTLRRQGVRAPVLGTSTIANDSFADYFADEPEERQARGFFTDGVYAAAPLLLDSANATTLAFADRYHARYGRVPPWEAVQGYDTTRLAIAAARAAMAAPSDAAPDLRGRREVVRAYLASLNGLAHAVAGVTGPLWFTPARGRQQAVRVGRFHGALFESAPLQLFPVTTPNRAELASGAVFEVEPGHYARRRRVVYTGVFLNDIPRLDLTRSSFSADFYLWLRFARDAGPDSADPTDIKFPTLLSGSFDRTRPVEQEELADGTEYRLWRVQGEFHNDFHLHRFPFDRQALSLSFFHAHAATDHIVYVLDKGVSAGERPGPPLPASRGTAMAASSASGAPPVEMLSLVSSSAFRNLTHWDPLGAHAHREHLVTASGLGHPTRFGMDSARELSGFLMTVELHRRTLVTLAKTLMPLLLVTLIMYASLYFPVQMGSAKVSIAITGALSGAVLMTAINTQLGGNIGYTIALEYVFYVFFGLSLLCILSVLGAERLRAVGRGETATRTEHWTRTVFLLAVAGTVVGTWVVYWD